VSSDQHTTSSLSTGHKIWPIWPVVYRIKFKLEVLYSIETSGCKRTGILNGSDPAVWIIHAVFSLLRLQVLYECCAKLVLLDVLFLSYADSLI